MNVQLKSPDLLAQCQANRKTLLAENAVLIAQRDALLGALQAVLQHCVTVKGMPDKGKGRTVDQQIALDQAIAAISKASNP